MQWGTMADCQEQKTHTISVMDHSYIGPAVSMS